MNNKSKRASPAHIVLSLFEKSKELGRILGLDGTCDILSLLDENPRQYKELDAKIDFSQTSLSRRLNILQSLDIIKKQPIRSKRRETHEYALTLRGAELMKFIISYEKEMKLPVEQQKIIDVKKKQ
ncbi:MAG: winged helix-turn-helix transcriptional regulator [Candidatus Thermoplasmatota archaeon]